MLNNAAVPCKIVLGEDERGVSDYPQCNSTTVSDVQVYFARSGQCSFTLLASSSVEELATKASLLCKYTHPDVLFSFLKTSTYSDKTKTVRIVSSHPWQP